MKNILKEFKYMLSSDGSDKLSSKRVITFLAFVLVSIAFISNLSFGISVDQNMFDGIIQIVWAGLGVTVGEHLLKKKNGDTPIEPTTEEPEEEEIDEEELGDN